MTPYLVSFGDATRRLSITSARLRSLIDAGLLTPHPLVGHSSRAMIDWYRDNRPDRTRDALARIVDA